MSSSGTAQHCLLRNLPAESRGLLSASGFAPPYLSQPCAGGCAEAFVHWLFTAWYGYSIYFPHSVGEHAVISSFYETCLGISFHAECTWVLGAKGWDYWPQGAAAPAVLLLLVDSLTHCNQKPSSMWFQSLNFSRALYYWPVLINSV